MLVVDDDPEFLEYVRNGLGDLALLVQAAQSPLEAFWILEREPIDLVLCDLALGSADGRHLLDRVRVRWPDVARVLVTGFRDRLCADVDVPAAQAVILKPCDLASLRALLGCLAVDREPPATVEADRLAGTLERHLDAHSEDRRRPRLAVDVG